jgi:hypothetical protein
MNNWSLRQKVSQKMGNLPKKRVMVFFENNSRVKWQKTLMRCFSFIGSSFSGRALRMLKKYRLVVVEVIGTKTV